MGPIGRFLVHACSVYVKLVPKAILSEPIRSSERALSYGSGDPQTVARLLDGQRLECLDVGARGGPLSQIDRFGSLVDWTLCEPDPTERQRLEDEGYAVIGALLGAEPGTAILNITRNPGNTSMLSPDGTAMHYYAGDSDRFDILEKIELPVTTLDQVASARGAPFDMIKLDTQGSERFILEAGQQAEPLLVFSEVSTGELYRDQATFYEIGQLLNGRGYILCDLSLRRVRPADRKRLGYRGRAALGIPLHGDACFVADWMRPEGRALIAGRERQWAALMVMTGQEEILRHVLANDAIGEAANLMDAIG